MFRVVLLSVAILGAVNATLILPTKPAPTKPAPTCAPAKCNIYDAKLVWVLEDCVCRCIQNQCLMDQENVERCSKGKTPLVPISEKLCKSFIPKKCCKGLPVVAQFPKPPKCGCKNKPGTIVERTFKSACEMRRYSALNNEAYTSYKICLFPPIKKLCK